MRNENYGRHRPGGNDFGRESNDDQGGSRSSYDGRSGENMPYRGGHDRDESFQDQRNPQNDRGNQPRQWQGRGYGGAGGQGGRGNETGGGFGEQGGRGGVDQRSYGRGNQFGRAGEYGRAHEQMERQGFSGDYDRGDNYGRGNERMREEAGTPYDSSGSYAGGRGESVHSRSADPGQSSYGGFSNEDTRFQRQQLDPYSGGRGYPRQHQGDQYGHQGAQQQRYSPKGYSRSDERVREDICERLSHSGLDVSEVSVEVSKGQVTLEGTVKDRQVKHAIENYADACMGVQDVDNRIRVEREQGYGRGETSMDQSSSADSSRKETSTTDKTHGGNK